MKRTIRKQNRNDFESRIKRLDPQFAATRPCDRYDERPWEPARKSGFKRENPVMMTLLGLVLAVSALFAVTNPDAYKALLLQTGWPAQFLTYATNGASIVSVGLVVLLLGNVVRIFNPNATGRWNAGGLVLGGLAGILAFNVPGTYYDAGYALLGFENATDALDYAQARTLELASVDWASVVMVSSAAK